MQNEQFAIENASVWGDQLSRFHDFSLHIYKGHVLGIVCNTLIEKELIIALFQGKCTISGKVRVNCLTVHNSSGSIFQSRFFLVDPKHQLNTTMSVAENICLPMSGLSFIRKKELQRKTLEYMKHLQIHLDLSQKISDLSARELVLIKIVKAYALERKIIILNDLPSVLNHAECMEVFGIVKQLCSEGFSFVMINAPESSFYQQADELLIIKNRTSIGRFPVSFSSSLEYHRYVLSHDQDLIPEGSVTHHDFGETDGDTEDLPIMEFKDIYTSGLHDISFSLYPGSVSKIYCLDSSSLEAFKKLITGQAVISKGEILLKNQTYSWPKTPLTLVQDGILWCPEIPYNHILFQNKTVLENIQYTISRKTARIWINADYKASAVQYIAENIGKEYVRQRISDLEPAVQTAVAYHKLLLQVPKVIFFERPFYHTDSGIKSVVLSMFSKLREQGISLVILTTSPELLNNNDGDNLYIKDGKMISEYDVYQELYGIQSID